ncbi:nuclear transport factor 2 family protein [Sphingomonas glacialis]|nr:nuclear transport factor 2 family protein [Sphingomonas glacialis]
MLATETLFRNHLALSTTDFDAWLELIHDDILLEFPYAKSAGNPTSMQGKAVVSEGVRAFFKQVPDLRFTNPTIYGSADPQQGFATYEVDTIVPATGRRYAQKYIAHFRITEGLLSYIAEYYDPVQLVNAFQLPVLM